ncbi:MAG: hypothetical protein JXQ29_03880 [Planctomycetes bacterium]|nr:hypothetical protein [Planctomycetota bacterium]
MTFSKRTRSVTVLLVLAAAGAVGAAQDEPQEAAARAREAAAFQKRVDEAIARGASWLVRQRGRKADYGPLPAEGALNTYDFPSGLTALAYYTLLTTGKKPAAAPLREIYQRLARRHARPATTYETAVLLMAIDARYSETVTGTPRDPVPPEQAGRDPGKAPPGCAYARDDWKWAAHLVGFLERAQTGGGWRYYTVNAALSFDRDVSATVFALLGLVTASRAGYAVPPRVFQDASRFLCDLQESQPELTTGEGGLARGFPYGPGRTRDAMHVSGGTTAAGLASLHLCRLECRRLGVSPDGRLEAAIRDAEKWLDENWEVQRNPKAHHYLYCYLYALERIGSLSGRETIGAHPWYREGAEYLLAEQETKTGRWDDTSSCAPTDVLGTCFALLFLKRATRAVTAAPPAAPPEAPATPPEAPATPPEPPATPPEPPAAPGRERSGKSC